MADQSRRSSRTSMRSKPLGQLLAENGDVSTAQVSQAVRAQEEQGGMLGAILQRMGACGPEAIGQALSKQVQVTDIQCEDVDVARDAVKLVPREFCGKEKLCPFEKLDNLLCVVMGNPLNRKAISEIEGMSRMKVKAFKAPWPKISELIDRAYSSERAPAQSPAKSRQPVEDLSFDLQDVPAVKPGKKVEIESPADEDFIIPAAELDENPAGPTGILEIPVDNIRLPSHAGMPAQAIAKPPPVQPKIKGLDDLDFTGGELVDVVPRKIGGVAAPAKKAALKIAQVNVDLDRFDASAATETFGTQPPEADAMEEIQHRQIGAAEDRNAGPALVALKIVPDGYFYAGTAPKNAPRSDDLMDIIEALPVAEVVAESLAEFKQKKSPATPAHTSESDSWSALAASGMAGNRMNLQRAPVTPMAAIRLGEGEFQKLTLTQVEDDLGEWDWNFASMGPVPVDAFEE